MVMVFVVVHPKERQRMENDERERISARAAIV